MLTKSTMRRYGVYAAVFLRKAATTGALHSDEQIQKATDLAISFANAMEQAASHKSQIGSKCSRMLKRLWQRPRQQQDEADASASAQSMPRSERQGTSGESDTAPAGHQGAVESVRSEHERISGEGCLLNFNQVDLSQPTSADITLDESLFDSFMLDFDFLGSGNFQEPACAQFTSFELGLGQI